VPKLPAGAIVGIVLGGIFLLAIVIIIVLRRRSVNKRLRLRAWASTPPPFLWIDPEKGLGPITNTKSSFIQTPVNSRNVLSGTTQGQGLTNAQSSRASIAIPARPPTAFGINSDYNLSTPSTGSPTSSSERSVVVAMFIPKLPDELSITIGETLRVLSEFDDGWVVCSNSRGEVGMVPVECLARGNTSSESSQEGGSARPRRASSLILSSVPVAGRS